MEESTLTKAHLPCPTCGSHDALSEYSDGHTHCFSCGTTKFLNDDKRQISNQTVFTSRVSSTHISNLPKRGILGTHARNTSTKKEYTMENRYKSQTTMTSMVNLQGRSYGLQIRPFVF